MAKRKKRTIKPAGSAPGTLVYIGENRRPSKITRFRFDREQFEEGEMTVEELRSSGPDESDAVTWINVEGVSDVSAIEAIGAAYDLSPLVLEDIVNTEQRPKKEDHERYIFLCLKMLSIGDHAAVVVREQVSIVLGKNFVLTFQDGVDGDVFDPVRQRLRTGKGRLRRSRADYLAYALVDLIVDHYFVVLERLSERYDLLEERIMTADRDTLPDIMKTKKQMLIFRQAVWPVRDIATSLVRDESPLISKDSVGFLRDVYDHVIEVIEVSEVIREMIGVAVELHLTSIGNKTNEIMKVLAIISTIFMPLSFIAGVYGMNFRNMPELEWQSGYPMALGLMIIVALIFLNFFRKRGWI